MLKKLLILFAAVSALIAFTSCNKELEYNSNSGNNGSRDSASQLLVNTSKTEDLSAPDADNEDWFFFTPPEKGFVSVVTFVDKPSDIIINISIMDNFGRPINSVITDKHVNMYELPEIPVEKENYFIALKTTEGKSAYTIKANFRLPDPEPDCEIGTFKCIDNVLNECQKTGYTEIMVCEGETSVCDEEVGECKAAKASSGHTKCVPANKCKPGQKCCKSSSSGDDEGISDTEKTIKGTIVLVTPRDNNLADVKINGLGERKGVKKGAKAYLRGLKRKVDIYDCKTTYCMATIKATSEELTHYDTVDVVVE